MTNKCIVTFSKTRTYNGPFPRPGDGNPYMEYMEYLGSSQPNSDQLDFFLIWTDRTVNDYLRQFGTNLDHVEPFGTIL